jgi:serine/threonine protein kinase
LPVCDAIQHAHERAILHRDIKPSNVLLTTQDGKLAPKVIDFGIAKAMNEGMDFETTQTGQVIGTPGYMSPEQADNSPIDTRTDVYSLGVLLYELLVGALPIDLASMSGAGVLEILLKIKEEEPSTPSTRILRAGDPGEMARRRCTDVRTLCKQLRSDLDRVVMKALEKDPGRRYASVSEFADDISRYLDHRPVLARSPTLGYRLQKFSRRHRWQVATAMTMVVILMVAALTGWVSSRQKYRTLLGRGGDQLAGFDKIRDERDDWRRTWKGSIDAERPWLPAWERTEELIAWRQFQELDGRLLGHFLDAQETFIEAAKTAPLFISHNLANEGLEKLYKKLHDQARLEGSIPMPPRFFKDMI